MCVRAVSQASCFRCNYRTHACAITQTRICALVHSALSYQRPFQRAHVCLYLCTQSHTHACSYCTHVDAYSHDAYMQSCTQHTSTHIQRQNNCTHRHTQKHTQEVAASPSEATASIWFCCARYSNPLPVNRRLKTALQMPSGMCRTSVVQRACNTCHFCPSLWACFRKDLIQVALLQSQYVQCASCAAGATVLPAAEKEQARPTRYVISIVPHESLR